MNSKYHLFLWLQKCGWTFDCAFEQTETSRGFGVQVYLQDEVRLFGFHSICQETQPGGLIKAAFCSFQEKTLDSIGSLLINSARSRCFTLSQVSRLHALSALAEGREALLSSGCCSVKFCLNSSHQEQPRLSFYRENYWQKLKKRGGRNLLRLQFQETLF